MSLPEVGSAAYPTPKEIHNQLLAAVMYYYDKQGLVANVKKDSEHWIRLKAYADQISIPIANNKIALADYSPLTAQGDALVTLADQFGVKARAASSSAGPATIFVSGGGSVTVPQDFICVAPDGNSYKAVVAQTLSDLGIVNLISVETGAGTAQAAGTVMTWADASIGTLGQKVIVGVKDSNSNTYTGEISGGEDGDDQEDLRRRLLERLAFPGVGGNWAYVKDVAEDSSASVGFAGVYNAVRGPASYDVALTKGDGDRVLDATIVSAVASGILALLPGHASLNVTTVTPQPLDVVVDMVLPLPVSAGGAGNGWRDAVPWPSTISQYTPVVSPGTTLTFAAATSDITTSGNWIGSGLLAGMNVVVTGSASNNTTFTITAISADGLVATVSPAPVNEVTAAATVTSQTVVPVRVVYKNANQVGVTSTSSNPPYVGVHFGIWDPEAEEMRTFTASAASGSSGFYLVTVDIAQSDSLSFIGDDGYIPEGFYVSTGAFNLGTYATEFIGLIRKLGPGEKSADINILPRGRRQPSIDVEHPASLTTLQLGQLSAEHAEILDLSYGARLSAGTATTTTTPSLPTTTADPPKILTLSSFAVRKT